MLLKKRKKNLPLIPPQVSIKEEDYLLSVTLHVNKAVKAKMICVVDADGHILIGDIRHINYPFNNGAGSLMMEYLLEYARKKAYKYIYGNLSTVDIDHQDRLHHFYRKFGFTITLFDELHDNYYGMIEKNLEQLESH